MSALVLVKGRGKYRGKYLRQRYSRKLNRAVTRWVRAQRRATRFDGQYTSGYDHTKRTADKVNGYLVKLIAPRSIVAEDLMVYIREHAARAEEPLDAYWIHGAGQIAGVSCDEATNFCHDCCVAKVEEIVAVHPKEAARVGLCVDGGWSMEHDSTPFCETCGAKLDGSLTDYGTDEELSVLTNYAAPSFDEPNGWAALADAIEGIDDDDTRWRKIARVVAAAQKEEREAADAAAALTATPGMAATRSALLSILGARQVQKAPEPSFRLWDEFQTWFAVPRGERSEEIEKRLFKEAKRFLGFCGIRAYMTNGGMGMAEAPHGTYYWPFIVETEQRRLWQDHDLEAGRSIGRACLESDDAPGRDANPFKDAGYDTPRARAWDDGFLLGLHEAERAGGSS